MRHKGKKGILNFRWVLQHHRPFTEVVQEEGW